MLARQSLVAVHAWPQCIDMAVDELRSSQALTVISVPTPATTNRLQARELIRVALRETLAKFFNQPAASITLVSQPGRAIYVMNSPHGCLQVSVSHMPGMSLAAITKLTGVGVDLMQVDQDVKVMFDWTHNWAQVALDYLGPVESGLLKSTPSSYRPTAFAEAWTRLEARLKCLGLALTEWTPILEKQLAACHVMALALPENYCGAIAINTSADLA